MMLSCSSAITRKTAHPVRDCHVMQLSPKLLLSSLGKLIYTICFRHRFTSRSRQTVTGGCKLSGNPGNPGNPRRHRVTCVHVYSLHTMRRWTTFITRTWSEYSFPSLVIDTRLISSKTLWAPFFSFFILLSYDPDTYWSVLCFWRCKILTRDHGQSSVMNPDVFWRFVPTREKKEMKTTKDRWTGSGGKAQHIGVGI